MDRTLLNGIQNLAQKISSVTE